MKLAVNDRVAVAVSGDEDAKLEKELEHMERMIDDEEAALESEALEQEEEDLQEQEEELIRAEEERLEDTSAELDIEEDGDLERELRDVLRGIEEAAKEELEDN
jgi:hypothetical protein